MARTPKTKLKQFSAYELIEKGVEAVEKDVITPGKFKSYFRVEFTFLQMYNYLTKKKIWGHFVLSSYEYNIIRANLKKKDELLYILKDIKARNTRTIYDDFDI